MEMCNVMDAKSIFMKDFLNADTIEETIPLYMVKCLSILVNIFTEDAQELKSGKKSNMQKSCSICITSIFILTLNVYMGLE